MKSNEMLTEEKNYDKKKHNYTFVKSTNYLFHLELKNNNN